MHRPQVSVHVVSLAAVIALAPGAHAAPSASVMPGKVIGLQPGWVRLNVVYNVPNASPKDPPRFEMTPTCDTSDGSAGPSSVTASTALVLTTPKVAYLDLRANLRWLAENGLPRPCRVTSLAVRMFDGATLLASATLTLSFPMDVPLSHLQPAHRLPSLPLVASVPLVKDPAATRYAAYPPRLLAVLPATGRISFIEVEELPSRGTVGLRALSTFTFGRLELELGGGAEVFPGWGIDVDRLGVTKETSGSEESHPGFDKYEYDGVQPPILSGDATLEILPAPPLFSEAVYLANTLDQRMVPRCTAPGGCLDVIYNAATHTLDAVNGARIVDLDPGPVPDPPDAHIAQRPLLLPAYENQMVRDLEAALRAVESGKPLPAGLADEMQSPSRNPELPIIDLEAVTLTAATPSLVPEDSTRDLNALSPEELVVGQLPFSLSGLLTAHPAASCLLEGDFVTSAVSRCEGFSQQDFRCPTTGDPLRVENLPPPPGAGSEVMLDLIPPYYKGRHNVWGTCGGHAANQYYETLLALYARDLAPQRVIYVDGLPVKVPAARVATSIASNMWQTYAWNGTHTGDPDLEPDGTVLWASRAPVGVITGQFPRLLDAYWPAREWFWREWRDSMPDNAARARCREVSTPDDPGAGFWWSAFCAGQGQPPPGVYRNYSQMVSGADPVSDVPWTLGNTYFNVVSHEIPLADRDAAIQAVIHELSTVGLPVTLSFHSNIRNIPVFDTGGTFNLGDGMSWFVPPELGACDVEGLNEAFMIDNKGHVVLIVGYAISGQVSNPDPFNSYFILENNWGKTAGYKSFYFMNFAAFKYLASSLTTYRLDASCWSAACESRPPVEIPAIAISRFLFPPDPDGAARRRYDELFRPFVSHLGGTPSFAGVAPFIPGIAANAWQLYFKRQDPFPTE